MFIHFKINTPVLDKHIPFFETAGIKEKVMATVAEAGPNVCPPIIVGVGLGGNFECSAILAKKALLRKLDHINPDPEVAALEQELLTAVNDLGIGPGGLGGRFTALGVKINLQPCHIASLPLVVDPYESTILFKTGLALS